MHASIHGREEVSSGSDVVQINIDRRKKLAKLLTDLSTISKNIHEARGDLRLYIGRVLCLSRSFEDSLSDRSFETTEFEKDMVHIGKVMKCLEEGLTPINEVVDEFLINGGVGLVVDSTGMENSLHSVPILKECAGHIAKSGAALEEGLCKIEGSFDKGDFLSSVKEIGVLFKRCRGISSNIKICFSPIKHLLGNGNSKKPEFDKIADDISSLMKLMCDRLDRRTWDLCSMGGPSCVLIDTTTASQECQPEVHHM